MKNYRKKLIYTIIIIVILITTMTIVYAALSATLTITGSASVQSSTWDIKLINSENYLNYKTGNATYEEPTISGTTISNYSVSLTQPGDSVILYFDVINNGDYNGEIASIINDIPTCTSSTGNTSDASLVCDNIDIKLTYATGDEISSGDVLNIDSYTCLNQTTTGYEETTLKLTIALKSTMTSVPGSKVTISNLKHNILYTQTEKECESEVCFEGQTKISTKEGFKEIKDIKVGDLVYSINLETNKKELKKVVNTFKRQTRTTNIIKTNNTEMETTALHPYYVLDNGWTSVKELNYNDKLYNTNNKSIQVKENKKNIYKEPITVYNFEVEDNHNYLITEDEILVHNWEISCGVTEEQ